MTSLIEATLSVSRMELGVLSIETQPIDIMDFARKELETLRVIVDKKNLLMKGSFVPDTFVTAIDPVLMRIIFQNLLSNAIKYTAEGGWITLAIEAQASRILIRVTDTGHGIPKEHQRHIFSRLYRASNAVKLDPHGSGLGLYIVKSIVDKTAGKIWFESREGRGTTFYITFPADGMKDIRGDIRLR